ncbi:MAG: helix-turn-helix domain-containing protein [Clostridium sp.]|nr:helix-turn-helix domain-containing protein [Clostridium sp.]
MITNQIIQTSIDELHILTKVDFAVFEANGESVATTDTEIAIEPAILSSFVASPADSQIIGNSHLLKIVDDGEIVYILIAKGSGTDTYIMGKIAVSQIKNLMIAYKERFDRNNFFQSLLLDNLLLVDIFNRAKKLHIDIEAVRTVFLIEIQSEKNSEASEMLRGLFSTQSGDYVTSVDANSIVLIKALEQESQAEQMESIASTIVDMMNTEAMANVRVAYGNPVYNLKDVSKSYKEARMAMDVGKIFYAERKVVSYATLGIGRLIYQLPVSLCQIFVKEIFGDQIPEELDEETLTTIHKFFENNLNVSETSRQLFVHRNTLVYRIEKLQKATGLDIRVFDDAMTLEIALMVVNYMRYLESMG